MTPQLVIPMTGISSRFTAAGYTVPKFLLEAEGITVVDHVIDMYPGWDDVVFICNSTHLDDPALDLERRLLARRPGATVVRLEGKGAGPGDAILQARDHIALDKPVVVNYCDFTVFWDPAPLAQRLLSGEVDGVIPVYSGFHPHMAHSTSYAYVKTKGQRAIDIQEKQPWTDDPRSEYASSGTYGFASGALLLRSLEKQVEEELLLGGEYYVSLTYKPLLAQGGHVEVMHLQHFMQWGTPQDFEEYRESSRAIARWNSDRLIGTEMSEASRVVLASGAGKRFSDAGYTLPKPVLPLAGRTVLEHALACLPGKETVVVTRKDLPDSGLLGRLASRLGAALVELEGLTRGQAESALYGLRAVTGTGPVTVGACDAIPTGRSAALRRAVELAGPDGLVVWLARPYHSAARNPGQYGWAVAGDDGAINDIWLKEVPGSDKAGVVIGTFTFGSASSAIGMIEELMADDERVRGEFYLDSLISRQLRAGRPVVAFNTDSFIAVGTPAEYESARYWQSCFHKWSHHPYALAADPLVDPLERAELDAEFRDFVAFPGGSR
ncbi:NTP transferase domain-containing protein [Amnibacterium flavum]|uniref:MobA-like NTP transferase domain-containing protein n=1 Tax=Amnibacterium flavum TaxID=2173173 RepID=A0A2V1HX60_9MICO|nr:NTP transferase domain-containing protein [Amnibacterium flavum]PVZ95859.1 hypothetical protein DDQ50_05185 [Amnibacterium flavum]